MLQRLRWKVFALVATVVLTTSVLSAVVASVLIRDEIKGLLADDLKDKGRSIRERIAGLPDARVQTICREQGDKWSVRFTVIAADGRVRGDSAHDPATMVNHGSRPEVAAAMEGRVGRDSRLSQTKNIEYLYVAQLIDANNRSAGVVRVAVPLTQVQIATHRAYKIIGLTAVVALVLALVLGLWGSRRLTGPIGQMVAFARRMAEGDFRGSLAVRSGDEIGSLGNALLSMRDQLREKIEALEQERKRLGAILGGMNEGVVATDASRRVIFANAALGKFLDTDSAQVADQELHAVCRSPELNDLVEQALRSGEPHTREISPFGANGIAAHLYVAPIPVGGSEGAGVICVFRDVTELRNLERMRIEFVANASHELKTPLSSIIGSLETLTSGAADDPEARDKFLSIAETNSRRLHALVSDLLDLSRIESDDRALDCVPIDVRTFLEKVRAAFSDRLGGKKQALEIRVQEDLTSVTIDETLLDQALYNLIDNSIKYTPEEGRITVAVDRKGQDVIFSVSDTGIGIPQKDLPRLFERFYRVDKARSREMGGTGLGLAIVKHVALAHGGRVEALSAPGQGTTIRLVLPAS